MRRIDMILNAEPQKETAQPKRPASYDISFEDVTFTYEGQSNRQFLILVFVQKLVQQQPLWDIPVPVRVPLPA